MNQLLHCTHILQEVFKKDVSSYTIVEFDNNMQTFCIMAIGQLLDSKRISLSVWRMSVEECICAHCRKKGEDVESRFDMQNSKVDLASKKVDYMLEILIHLRQDCNMFRSASHLCGRVVQGGEE